MPTRLKRPSLVRMLTVSVALIGFQVYLGYSAWRGQFGIDSQQQMLIDIEVLKAKSAALQAEISTYRHRVDLFDPAQLDPDLLTERARALLGMAQPDDLVIIIDPESGLPRAGLGVELASDQLSTIIGDEATQ